MLKGSLKGKTKGLVLRKAEMKKYPAAFRAFYQQLVMNALRREIPMELSVEEIYRLVQLPCHYCGQPPERRVFGTMRYEARLNGLDRLSSERAYDEENTVPACRICNRVKHVATFEEYLSHARRIVAFNKKVSER